MSMRATISKIAAAAALACIGVPAHADPISLIAAGAAYGFTGTAALIVGAVATYGGYALLAYQIYGGIDARRKAKAAQRNAIRAYNASLTDRNITAVQAIPPWRVVYGECITGGDVVAIFTSDKPTVSKSGGSSTRPDGLKHIVIALATHECEALGEIYVDGTPLGGLDGSGYALGSDWQTNADTQLVTVNFADSISGIAAVSSVVSAVSEGASEGGPWSIDRTVTIGGGGTSLSISDGMTGVPLTVVYRTALNPAVIRVQKHLGTDSQTVDTYLNGIKPTEWTTAHRLRGIAYLVVTLDLEDPRFQGGPPNITCMVKGKKLYDPRQDSTNGGSGSHRYTDPSTWAWSDNPALCVRDWITGQYGMESDHADVLDSFTIAAANACDVTFTADIGGTTSTQRMYRCNGVATTDQDREQILRALADSMAGFAVYGAQWQILAGAWTAPVMTLTDDDLDGQIEIVQAGAGIDELFNGVRGTYIAADKATPADFEPYQNAAFVTSDGEALWTDITLPFTQGKHHASNIARVLTERARNSLTISYPAKLRALPLQIGDRVTVTSAEYGYTAKTFRVTDWQFGLQAPVTLVLEEDAEAAYDLVDAVEADPTPNTDLPDPWSVEAINLLTPASGNDHLMRTSDGAVVPRVLVSWDALTGPYMRDPGARVVLRWRRVGPDADWTEIEVNATETSTYLLGVQAGDRLVIEARARNPLGFFGALDVATHTVVGKTSVPANVSGLAAAVQPGAVLVSWTANTADPDFLETEVRQGATWAGGQVLYRGRATSFRWTWPSAGTYTLRARHRDTSGNISTTDATASVTVDEALLINAPELRANAATKVHTATASGVSVTGEKGVPTGSFTDIVTYTFTPAVDCEVLISCEGTGSISTASSGLLGDYAMLSTRITVNGTQQGPLRTYAIDLLVGFSVSTSCGFARAQRFSATGGVSYTVVLQGQQYVAITTCTVDATMRIEEIKR